MTFADGGRLDRARTPRPRIILGKQHSQLKPIHRRTVQFGVAFFSALSIAGFATSTGRAEPTSDRYPANSGEIVVTPIRQASFVLQVPGMVIYNDPVGGKALFKGQPMPDLVLVCHEHGDHLDVQALSEIVGDNTRLIVNRAVMEQLPAKLRAQATALANGETATVGSAHIEAIPAYHTVPGYTQYHPRGRDNGYVLTVAGRRIYISGDTDATPEVRALKDIHIAFLAISRWTLTPERGASAVASFKPDFAYPYHFESVGERDAFAREVRAATDHTTVVSRDWDG